MIKYFHKIRQQLLVKTKTESLDKIITYKTG